MRDTLNRIHWKRPVHTASKRRIVIAVAHFEERGLERLPRHDIDEPPYRASARPYQTTGVTLPDTGLHNTVVGVLVFAKPGDKAYINDMNICEIAVIARGETTAEYGGRNGIW